LRDLEPWTASSGRTAAAPPGDDDNPIEMDAELNPMPEAARLLGIDYVAGPLEKAGGSITGGAAMSWTAGLAGSVDGVPVRVGVSGGRRSVVLIYGAVFPHLGMALDIRRRTVLTAHVWPPGRATIAVRGRLVAKARPGNADGEALVLAALESIVGLTGRLPNLVVSDSTIDGSERRSLFDMPEPGDVAAVVRHCVDVARALST
jgi:hypothetical protein